MIASFGARPRNLLLFKISTHLQFTHYWASKKPYNFIYSIYMFLSTQKFIYGWYNELLWHMHFLKAESVQCVMHKRKSTPLLRRIFLTVLENSLLKQ